MSIRFACLKVSLVVAAIAWATPSRADVAAQTCLPSLVTCAEGDVGKDCPSGGQCESVFCRTDGSAMTMYRCITTNDAGTTTTPHHDLTSGGCNVASRATGPGAIAFVLLLAGALILLADRRRKSDR